MGTLLDKPRTEKYNESSEANDLSYGLSTMQGWRVDMEDAHAAKIGLDDKPPLNKWAFFAVFDGHAGCKVAQYGATQLLRSILATEQVKQALQLLTPGSDASDGARRTEKSEDVRALIRAGVRDGFLQMDSEMRTLLDLQRERSGSTAVAVLITPGVLFFANLGDSRGILSRSCAVSFATVDHKPYMASERARILNAGGSVMIQRVNGTLAVSRALGDYEYKNTPELGPCEQLVSPEPDIYDIERDSGDEFILLACDGVFDVMQNEDVADLIRSRLRLSHDLPSICNLVTDACLSKGSSDNMSLILILLPGAPQTDPKSVEDEAALLSDLETRVRAIASECGSLSDLEPEYVIRVLQMQNLPNLPPGAGLHALRSAIEDIVKTIIKEDDAMESTQGNEGS